ncbi:hypothetical protein G7Y89_g1198 [Cudoniella acicularis]|uniref:Uncharacterized protein n=1 Tax=Cudoniella acicularis TaxID=354080 RepID=A0A8H4RVQ5_9HELO|nr:hypothetical protein G7Y89_g1198 [Cudoniella acicularis]
MHLSKRLWDSLPVLLAFAFFVDAQLETIHVDTDSIITAISSPQILPLPSGSKPADVTQPVTSNNDAQPSPTPHVNNELRKRKTTSSSTTSVATRTSSATASPTSTAGAKPAKKHYSIGQVLGIVFGGLAGGVLSIFTGGSSGGDCSAGSFCCCCDLCDSNSCDGCDCSHCCDCLNGADWSNWNSGYGNSGWTNQEVDVEVGFGDPVQPELERDTRSFEIDEGYQSTLPPVYHLILTAAGQQAEEMDLGQSRLGHRDEPADNDTFLPQKEFEKSEVGGPVSEASNELPSEEEFSLLHDSKNSKFDFKASSATNSANHRDIDQSINEEQVVYALGSADTTTTQSPRTEVPQDLRNISDNSDSQSVSFHTMEVYQPTPVRSQDISDVSQEEAGRGFGACIIFLIFHSTTMKIFSASVAIAALFGALPLFAAPSGLTSRSGGNAYPASTNTTTTEVDFRTRNYNTLAGIYEFASWPKSAVFIKNGVSAIPPGLFNANASGRISPVGNFSGIEQTAEYFFGLSPQAEAPFYIGWTSFEIHQFSSECPEVASSKVWGRTTIVNPGAPNDGEYLSTLMQQTFWRFDDTGAVIAYDATLPNLGDWFGKAYQNDFSDRKVQMGEIELVCGQVQQRCTGANQQYNSTADCIVALGQKNFGVYDEVWGDNVVCRSIHSILAGQDPTLHCPHCGPTGGGKCVDVDYNDVYFDDEALYGRTDAFKCPEIAKIPTQEGSRDG